MTHMGGAAVNISAIEQHVKYYKYLIFWSPTGFWLFEISFMFHVPLTAADSLFLLLAACSIGTYPRHEQHNVLGTQL